jgi:hypothetical protein
MSVFQVRYLWLLILVLLCPWNSLHVMRMQAHYYQVNRTRDKALHNKVTVPRVFRYMFTTLNTFPHRNLKALMMYKAYISVKGEHARCFQDSSLVGYCALHIDRFTNDSTKLSATIFRKVCHTLLLLPWIWRQGAPPKRRWLFTTNYMTSYIRRLRS